jgi:hypothetical protein
MVRFTVFPLLSAAVLLCIFDGPAAAEFSFQELMPNFVSTTGDTTMNLMGTDITAACPNNRCTCKFKYETLSGSSSNNLQTSTTEASCILSNEEKAQFLAQAGQQASGETVKVTVTIVSDGANAKQWPKLDANGDFAGECEFTQDEVCGWEIEMYDPSHSEMTGLSLVSGATTSNHLVEIQGLALPESNFAHCLVLRDGDSTAEPWMTVLASFNSPTSYSCEFPALADSADELVDQMVQVHLTMSDDENEIVPGIPATFAYIMPAPEIMSINVIRGGAGLLVTWNYPVEESSAIHDCSSMWTTATVQRLGESPFCVWYDMTHIEIELGAGATIQAYRETSDEAQTVNVLEIKSNIYTRARALLGASQAEKASGETALSVISDDDKAVLVVVGPTTVSSCAISGSLTLRAIVRGTTMQPFPSAYGIEWEATYRNIAGNPVGSKTGNGEFALSTAGLFASAVSVVVIFNAAAADSIDAAEITVRVIENSPMPVVFFEAGHTLKATPANDLEIKARTVVVGCATDTQVSYTTEVVGTTIGQVDGLQITIPANQLAAGTYSVMCKADGEVVSQMELVLTHSKLVASVIGGSRRSLRGGVQTTLVAAWPDQDIANDGENDGHISYSWTCASCGSLFDSLTRNERTLIGLTLDAAAGTKTYTLILEVSDAFSGRRASTAVAIEVRADYDHANGVSPLNTYIVSPVRAGSTDNLIVAATYEKSIVDDGSRGTVKWSVVAGTYSNPTASYDTFVISASTVVSEYEYEVGAGQIGGSQYSDERPAVLDLVIKPSSLLPGRSYIVRVDATGSGWNNDIASSFAEITVVIPRIPGSIVSNSVRVFPQSGQAQHTRFDILAIGYTSETALQYIYAIKLNDGSIVEMAYSFSDSLADILLPATAVSVGVKAADLIGSSTNWAWTSVDISRCSQDSIVIKTARHSLSIQDFHAPMQNILSALYNIADFEKFDPSDVIDATLHHLDLYCDVVLSMLHFRGSRASAMVTRVAEAILYAMNNMGGSPTLVASEKAASILSKVALSLTDNEGNSYASKAECEHIIRALDAAVPSSTIASITIGSVIESQLLASIDVLVSGMLAPICSSVTYGESKASISTNLFSAVAVRAPYSGLTAPGGAVAEVDVTSRDAVGRDVLACTTNLKSGSTDRSACRGSCLEIFQVGGDILTPPTVEGAIAGSIWSDAISIHVEVESSDRRSRRAVAKPTVFFEISTVCNDGTLKCFHCREWDGSSWSNVNTQRSENSKIKCTSATTRSGSLTSTVAVFKACLPGFIGRGCVSNCAEDHYGQDCLGVETCDEKGEVDHITGACSCASGFAGHTCEYACDSIKAVALRDAPLVGKLNQGYGNTCSSPSACEARGTESCNIYDGTCNCKAGYSGRTCAVDINECTTSECENGVCIDGIATYTCNCAGTGYNGGLCNIPTDQCVCENEADCIEIFVSADVVPSERRVREDSNQRRTTGCKCQPGFEGVWCESYCPDGKWGQGCTQDCSCSKKGVCHAVTGECSCDKGFKGSRCSASTSPANSKAITLGVCITMVLFAIVTMIYCKKHHVQHHHHLLHHHHKKVAPEAAAADVKLKDDPFKDLDAVNFESFTSTAARKQSSDYSTSQKVLQDAGNFCEAKASTMQVASMDTAVRPLNPGHMHVKKKTKNGEYALLRFDDNVQSIDVSGGDVNGITLSMLRDVISSMTPSAGVFYFCIVGAKDGEAECYKSVAEPTLHVRTCYTDFVLIRNVDYTDAEIKRELCICGKVSIFECSNCSLQGYCSEECQKRHWGQDHKAKCKATVAEQKSKAEELAAQLTESSDQNTAEECAVCQKPCNLECSRCSVVGYCSQKCQKQDWPEHQATCKAVEKAQRLSAKSIESAAVTPKVQVGLTEAQVSQLGLSEAQVSAEAISESRTMQTEASSESRTMQTEAISESRTMQTEHSITEAFGELPDEAKADGIDVGGVEPSEVNGFKVPDPHFGLPNEIIKAEAENEKEDCADPLFGGLPNAAIVGEADTTTNPSAESASTQSIEIEEKSPDSESTRATTDVIKHGDADDPSSEVVAASGAAMTSAAEASSIQPQTGKKTNHDTVSKMEGQRDEPFGETANVAIAAGAGVNPAAKEEVPVEKKYETLVLEERASGGDTTQAATDVGTEWGGVDSAILAKPEGTTPAH